MDTQTFIEYEVIEPISNKNFITSIRDEALEYFENHYMVYEYHRTITQASECVQSQAIVSLRWHLNPNFNPED